MNYRKLCMWCLKLSSWREMTTVATKTSAQILPLSHCLATVLIATVFRRRIQTFNFTHTTIGSFQSHQILQMEIYQKLFLNILSPNFPRLFIFSHYEISYCVFYLNRPLWFDPHDTTEVPSISGRNDPVFYAQFPETITNIHIKIPGEWLMSKSKIFSSWQKLMDFPAYWYKVSLSKTLSAFNCPGISMSGWESKWRRQMSLNGIWREPMAL